MIKLTVHENEKKGTIAPEIYGHFSEHLGRCIYEGIYVGENSPVPNVKGMRKDVVDALKDGDKVQLIGFGSFEVKCTKERMGQNPATGAKIKIPASKRPAFVASKALKDAING